MVAALDFDQPQDDVAGPAHRRELVGDVGLEPLALRAIAHGADAPTTRKPWRRSRRRSKPPGCAHSTPAILTASLRGGGYRLRVGFGGRSGHPIGRGDHRFFELLDETDETDAYRLAPVELGDQLLALKILAQGF